MEKIVALNSGGFDSICMLHLLRDHYPSHEIRTLFFDYGQTMVEEEFTCAKMWVKNDKNSSIIREKIDMPCSVDMTIDNEYIPMRNLIFLSLATSYAESIGADKVYIALIDNRQGDCTFYDCTEKFISDFNNVISGKGIKVLAPLIHMNKWNLYRIVVKHHIQLSDFHSCNFSKDRCGKCDDCITTLSIIEKANNPEPRSLWSRNPSPHNEEFIKSLYNTNIREVRVHNNHLCQLHCQHCYYGDYDLHGRELSIDEMWDRLFVPAIKIGVENFHFSGKEPLYNDDNIFEYARRIKFYNEHNNTHVTYDLITNGINLPKYIDQIKELGFSRICVSVDDIKTDISKSVRHINGVSPKALLCSVESGIPVEVFVSLYKGNCDNIHIILNTLYKEYGVRRFFLKTVSSIGHATGMDLIDRITLNEVYKRVESFCLNHEDVFVTMHVLKEYTYHSLGLKEGYCTELEFMMDSCRKDETMCIISNRFYLNQEEMCFRYYKQITVTPDGYILGCASEVATDEYWKNSGGNILESDLLYCIKSGRDKYISDIQKTYSKNENGCYGCNKCTFL